MAFQIQLRRGTASEWTSANPTLAAGEFGYESDTSKLKIGDGLTAWSSLSYFSAGSGDITGVNITAGNGLDITQSNTTSGNYTATLSADLKANGGIVVDSTELAVDLGASSITGTLAAADGGTGLTSISTLLNSNTTKSDVGLSNVENTALSTFSGTSNITTVGTISSGTWSGTAIDYDDLDNKPTLGTAAAAATGDFVAASAVSTFGGTLIDDADAAAARTTLGATTVGANVFIATSQAAARSAIGAATGTGDMVGSNNLSDLANAGTARTNLGLGSSSTLDVPSSGDAASGEVVKGNDSRLTDARTPTTTLEHDANKITTGQLPAARGGTGLSSVSTLLNSNTTKSDVGLGNVTNIVAFAASDVSTFGATLVDDADAATARTTLGLGNAAILDTGIGNTDLLKCGADVSQSDFLRINALSGLVEGRTAAEVLSDIGAATSAQGTKADSALQDVVSDTSPQLGGNLDVQARTITTSTTNGSIVIDPPGTGFLQVEGTTNPGKIRLMCEAGSHGVGLKSPPHSAGANYDLVLPTATGSANQLLKTDGSGNLGWTDPTTVANNVTSPAMTGVSAGSITGVIKCSQSQYDAISHDATTAKILYVIV